MGQPVFSKFKITLNLHGNFKVAPNPELFGLVIRCKRHTQHITAQSQARRIVFVLLY